MIAAYWRNYRQFAPQDLARWHTEAERPQAEQRDPLSIAARISRLISIGCAGADNPLYGADHRSRDERLKM